MQEIKTTEEYQKEVEITEEEIEMIVSTKGDLGLKGGFGIGNPIPDEYALDYRCV